MRSSMGEGIIVDERTSHSSNIKVLKLCVMWKAPFSLLI